ncbi:MAG: bifunctional diaminohydroxyphosphoribosylaminopyrimidine deaminase/5-amino-6-(5-phosphoribosylamino)uracil reductase RibD [Gammaproteobacteria bacterium]|nr:bifunctional diaminohydroxyphosphoribosylaminopyrimidine deaminase/5-amino-6-(5-phosphoribosylamino)uracil reductase RibD [Gammaproteobacteria bacterium]
MLRALQLARQGLYRCRPNPQVGCVLVKEGEIIAEGWHQRAGEGHAEVNALQQAGVRARGATAYVTLEPCCHYGRTSPCSEALINAGVVRVVVAMQDPNPVVAGKGIQSLREAGIEVSDGLLQDEAEQLNEGFIKRMRTGRPFVRAKLAMSLDGRSAMASGESQWITGGAARQDVQRLRARSGAIVTGIGTVLADDPSLNVRADDLCEQIPNQPLRVVMDSNLRMPTTAKMLSLPGDTLVVSAVTDITRSTALQQAGAEIKDCASTQSHVDLESMLAYLSTLEVNEVLLEAGAILNGAMLQQGLVDELVIYMAPHIMGANARGLFLISGLDLMQDRIALDIKDIRAVGEDWRITVRPRFN